VVVVAEVVAWWAMLVDVWVLTLSGTTVADVVAAAGAALVAAVAGVAARRVVGGVWLPRARWLGWLPVVATGVVTDTTRLLAFAMRNVRNRNVEGAWSCVPVACPPGVGVDPHVAFAALAITTTPRSFVCDLDDEPHHLIEHSIAGGRPRVEAVVAP
jgi:hypothetical protein